MRLLLCGCLYRSRGHPVPALCPCIMFAALDAAKVRVVPRTVGEHPGLRRVGDRPGWALQMLSPSRVIPGVEGRGTSALVP